MEGYCRCLRRDRGLAETTVARYRRCLRDFLVSRGDAVSPAELVALSADDLLAFSRQRGAGVGRTAWNHLATALSGFCRWLDLCGHGGAHLAGAVPLRRRCRLAGVPCALSWEQVRRLLGAVDLREPNGRRNYAMLLLIASYGLRGCEVRALRLNDIERRQGQARRAGGQARAQPGAGGQAAGVAGVSGPGLDQGGGGGEQGDRGAGGDRAEPGAVAEDGRDPTPADRAAVAPAGAGGRPAGGGGLPGGTRRRRRRRGAARRSAPAGLRRGRRWRRTPA